MLYPPCAQPHFPVSYLMPYSRWLSPNPATTTLLLVLSGYLRGKCWANIRNGRSLGSHQEVRCRNLTTYLPIPLFFQIMLGIFFNVHSAVLIEDVPFTEKDFE